MRLGYLASVMLAIGIFYVYDLQRFLEIDYLYQILNLVNNNLELSALVFSVILVVFSVLNLPTFYFSILFGYLYGFIPGLLISLVSRTLGVILAYYNIHFLFFDVFTKRYGQQKQIQRINALVEEKGFSAIVILRSLYVFPTSFLNAAFSISKIKPSAYFVGSAIGLLPTSIINVSMGYFIKEGKQLSDQPLLIGLTVTITLLLIVFSLLYMRKLKA